jgi:hypothetical protein
MILYHCVEAIIGNVLMSRRDAKQHRRELALTGASKIPPDLRTKDVFHHIDMAFSNRRLCMTALPPPLRNEYIERAKRA